MATLNKNVSVADIARLLYHSNMRLETLPEEEQSSVDVLGRINKTLQDKLTYEDAEELLLDVNEYGLILSEQQFAEGMITAIKLMKELCKI